MHTAAKHGLHIEANPDTIVLIDSIIDSFRVKVQSANSQHAIPAKARQFLEGMRAHAGAPNRLHESDARSPPQQALCPPGW